ncbi:MAG: TetR/AcrR family transcriptional regulator [Deltaproteobacteria bacterium]|nr:TetR/AcrR family transcriptional regulator [Deltaproteobacteria bacterium]MBN2673334.1 TetR/AcrR family transcriptional regulator [Deltaproteobacteria bacterium]
MVRPKKISDDEVLEIARQCFLEKGPQVSTLEIAKRVGLSQPTLFKRFKTKEDLFLAALGTKAIFVRVMELISWLGTHPRPGDFEPQIEELLTRLWNVLIEILPRVIAMHSQRSRISPDKLISLMKKPPPVRVLEGIIQFVKRAQRNGQIDNQLNASVLAMNLMGAMQGRVFFTRILSYADTLSDDVYILETARNFCREIKTQER